MRLTSLMLAISCLSPFAVAQAQSTPRQDPSAPMLAASEPHIISANELKTRPTFKPVIETALHSGLSYVATSVTLIWDASGKVTDLKLDKPTGYKPLDRAIVRWATSVELNAEQPGEGTLLLTLSTH